MDGAFKPARFHRAARTALLELPVEVRKEFGHALWLVQNGETPGNASPFEGSSGNDIMKLVERFETDTYRCVYAAKFKHYLYILHVFKKKSTSGIRTPRKQIETVKERFKWAIEDHEQRERALSAARQQEDSKKKP